MSLPVEFYTDGFCKCGHFYDEHAFTHEAECEGRVGNDGCTCLGYREAASSKKAQGDYDDE